jgi:transcriptional pleiotropic regulator of transition state genes
MQREDIKRGGLLVNQVKSKVISKSGSLTIPSDIRREYYSFLAGEAVDITVDDGKLVITPHAPRCIFCDSIQHVVKFQGKHACKECIAAMAKEVGLDG